MIVAPGVAPAAGAMIVPPPAPNTGFSDTNHHAQRLPTAITFNPQESFFRRLEKPVPASRVRFGERVPPVTTGRRIPPERQQLLPERVVPDGAHGFIGMRDAALGATSSARA